MLNKILGFVEKTSAKWQGRGWGSSTVAKEFSTAVSLLNDKDVRLCVDIGGNKGIYTAEIIRLYPNANIVIFEPAKSNVDVLNSKYANNANIVIEQLALSNNAGKATLFSNEDGSGLASLTKRRLDHIGIEFDNTESIRTIRFEEYWKTVLGNQHISVCKIDIEGHELDALNGFGEALNHIDVIQFEFGGCNIDTRTFFRDFWYFFQQNNYELYRITPFGAVKITRYRELNEFFRTTNYLAKRISL